MAETARIAICVPTFKRPVGLKRLLEGINEIDLPDPAPDVKIVIVDNDPDRGAAALIEELKPTLRFPVSYSHQTKRGISPSRNQALNDAGNVDWIVFIDDDERPEKNWLTELLRVQQEYQADVVQGPAEPIYDIDPPAWIVKGNFFRRPRFKTGHLLDRGSTRNILFRADLSHKLGAQFDLRLALLSGEDGLFFRNAYLSGFKIVWADEALVWEWIPEDRMIAKYLIRRQFATGCQDGVIGMTLFKPPKAQLRLIAKAAYRIVYGSLKACAGLILGKRILVNGIQDIAHGVGRIVGMLGILPEQYRVTQGK
ncbi:MAG: glycosyltransferase family 2 protein [bacterium]